MIARLIASFLLLTLAVLPAQAEDKGLLYALSKDGAAMGHIFGTMHSGDPRVATLKPAAEAAFDKADTLVVELVIDMAAQLEVTRRMLMTDGRRLNKMLSPEMFETVTDKAAQKGLPPQMVMLLKPWAAAVVIGTPNEDPNKVLDLALQARAKAAGKKIVPLETAGEQLEAFDTFSEADQVAILVDTVENLDDIPQTLADMIDAYAAGDLDRLVAITEKSKASLKPELARQFGRQLVLDRNKRMIERMLPLLGEGQVFVAIGALHLPGEGGLLELLRQNGYTVQPAG
ncbi:MAG: TraB/GumN family protein [Magnetospiraceae bacterium]